MDEPNLVLQLDFSVVGPPNDNEDIGARCSITRCSAETIKTKNFYPLRLNPFTSDSEFHYVVLAMPLTLRLAASECLGEKYEIYDSDFRLSYAVPPLSPPATMSKQTAAGSSSDPPVGGEMGVGAEELLSPSKTAAPVGGETENCNDSSSSSDNDGDNLDDLTAAEVLRKCRERGGTCPTIRVKFTRLGERKPGRPTDLLVLEWRRHWTRIPGNSIETTRRRWWVKEHRDEWGNLMNSVRDQASPIDERFRGLAKLREWLAELTPVRLASVCHCEGNGRDIFPLLGDEKDEVSSSTNSERTADEKEREKERERVARLVVSAPGEHLREVGRMLDGLEEKLRSELVELLSPKIGRLPATKVVEFLSTKLREG